MVSASVRRRQVEYALKRGLSSRRACKILHVARSALKYESLKAVADAPICERMKTLAAQFSRYGSRFVRIFLEREGHHMSFTRAYRLWNAAGLQVPRKRPRRRVAAAVPH